MNETGTTQMETPTPLADSTKSNSKMHLISLTVAIISLLISIFSVSLAYQFFNKEDDVTKEDIEFLSNFTNTLSFQHIIENGIVTDDFIVNKAIFRLQNQIPTAVIDIANQPSMVLKYKNNGDFDLTDRELRNKVSDLLDEVKEAYNSFGMNQIYSWDKLEIIITIQNYEIATYKGGETLLKGE